MLARKNLLLQSLPFSIFQSLEPDLKLVFLEKGVDLSSSAHSRRAYFPVSCVIAMYARADAMSDTFLCFAGVEGCAGLSERLTAPGLHYVPIVCGAGYAFVILREKFMRQVLPKKDELAIRLQSTSMVAQLGLINTGCATTHSSSQRIARILLQANMAWTTEEGRVFLEHREIADYVAVRRETVSNVLKEIERKNLITISRGHLKIIDLLGLKEVACSCAQTAVLPKASWLAAWQDIQRRSASELARDGKPSMDATAVPAGGGGGSCRPDRERVEIGRLFRVGNRHN